MSVTPLSARLFRFLAVVASAPFIVFMLVTGSHAEWTCGRCVAVYTNEGYRYYKCVANDDRCLSAAREYGIAHCREICRPYRR